MMVTISAFKDREEALISKALLEAAGVPVTLKDDFGELQLQVRDPDAQLAHDVLAPGSPSGWRKRSSGGYSGRYRAAGGMRMGREFIKGGGIFIVAFILLMLLLMPLGIALRVTPFALIFLFFLGGCFSLIRRFFKIKSKKPLRRGRR